jgi:hypothetical protein
VNALLTLQLRYVDEEHRIVEERLQLGHGMCTDLFEDPVSKTIASWMAEDVCLPKDVHAAVEGGTECNQH